MLLTAVIATYNEANNIKRCLDAVNPLVEEIIILDAYSTDHTIQIAAQFHKVKIVQHKWQGFSKSKNFANSLANNNWILSLDADEVISTELAKSITSWKKNNIHSPASFNRLSNYQNKWIKYCGWYPDKKTRIFNRINTHWQGEVHETLSINDPHEIVHLKGDLLHYTYKSETDFHQKLKKYSEISARHKFKKGKKAGFWDLLIRPFYKFISIYLLKLGFLEGKVGFNIALANAKSVYWKYKILQKLSL